MKRIMLIFAMLCFFPIMQKTGIALRSQLIERFTPAKKPSEKIVLSDPCHYEAFDTKAKHYQLKHISSFAHQRRFLERRKQDHLYLSQLYKKLKLAKVFFYEGMLGVWVNAGKIEGIKPNSPVTVGAAVIGVVEEVKEHRSRIRLITDAKLRIAARIAQGKWRDRFLWSQLLTLSHHCSLFEEYQQYTPMLQHCAEEVVSNLSMDKSKLTLKGVLKGDQSLFKGNCLLKGEGFQCEHEDNESSAADVSTLAVEKGDLLVTSGLDGVFPPGLFLGVVEESHRRDFCYDLSASACVENLSLLEYVTILPPVSEKAYDP